VLQRFAVEIDFLVVSAPEVAEEALLGEQLDVAGLAPQGRLEDRVGAVEPVGIVAVAEGQGDGVLDGLGRAVRDGGLEQVEGLLVAVLLARPSGARARPSRWRPARRPRPG
jgi:hypothetical protein